jgi:hypothetical protein
LFIVASFLSTSCNTFSETPEFAEGTEVDDAGGVGGDDAGDHDIGALDAGDPKPQTPRLGRYEIAEIRSGEARFGRADDFTLGFDMTSSLRNGAPVVATSIVVDGDNDALPIDVRIFELDGTELAPPARSIRIPEEWTGTLVEPDDVAMAVRSDGNTIDLVATSGLEICPLDESRPTLAHAEFDWTTEGTVTPEVMVRSCLDGGENTRVIRGIDLLDSGERRFVLGVGYTENTIDRRPIAVPLDAPEFGGGVVLGPVGDISSRYHVGGAAGIAVYEVDDEVYGLWLPYAPDVSPVELRMPPDRGTLELHLVEADTQPIRYAGLTNFGVYFSGELDCGSAEPSQLACTEDFSPKLVDLFTPNAIAVASTGSDSPAFVTWVGSFGLETFWQIGLVGEDPRPGIALPVDPDLVLLETRLDAHEAPNGDVWLVAASISASEIVEPFEHVLLVRAVRLMEVDE